MNRDDMVKQLVEMGFDEENLKSATDELLAQMLKLSEPGDEDADQDSDQDEDEHLDMDDDEDQDAEEHAEGDDESKDKPPSEDEINSMSEEEAKDALKKMSAKYAEYAEDDKPGDKKGDDEAMKLGTGKFSEKALAEMVDKAVATSLEKHAGAAVARVQKFAEQAEGEQKRAMLAKFCETNLNAGKIEPWEMDETSGQPTLLDRLLACDATTKVFKFSEGKKTRTLTQLEVEMDAIEARPVRKFGEKIAAGKGDKTSADAEVAKVEAHFESFSEDFARMHTTKEELVEAFKISRKHNPDQTAEKFLSVGRTR